MHRNCKDTRKTAHFVNSESCCSHTVLPLLSKYCAPLPCCRRLARVFTPLWTLPIDPRVPRSTKSLECIAYQRCLIRPGRLRCLHLDAGPSGFRAQAFFRVQHGIAVGFQSGSVVILYYGTEGIPQGFLRRPCPAPLTGTHSARAASRVRHLTWIDFTDAASPLRDVTDILKERLIQ